MCTIENYCVNMQTTELVKETCSAVILTFNNSVGGARRICLREDLSGEEVSSEMCKEKVCQESM